MKSLPIALLTAALLHGATAAQDHCPQQSSQAQAASIQTGPPGACAGTNYELAGVQITTALVPCPTFCIYTPPHDLVVASTKKVRITTAALNPITMIKFRCGPQLLPDHPAGPRVCRRQHRDHRSGALPDHRAVRGQAEFLSHPVRATAARGGGAGPTRRT